MPPTLGAGARRVSAAALRTRLLAASSGGRAAWPTVRHLADKLGTPSLQGFLWMLGEVGSQFGLEGTPNLRFPVFPRGGRRRRIKFPQDPLGAR